MSQSLNNSLPRRTQAERRAETQAAVLSSACKLFGERGYNDTALEEIAKDCGVTIRPIYHYFENKQNLFKAVVEHTEQRVLETYSSQAQENKDHPFLQRWRAFLELCRDPAFCQILLIDSPNVLGHERWNDNAVAQAAQIELEQQLGKLSKSQAKLAARMIMAALAEAGVMIAHSKKPNQARRDADELVTRVFTQLIGLAG